MIKKIVIFLLLINTVNAQTVEERVKKLEDRVTVLENKVDPKRWISVADGKFYDGDKEIKFWGVNFASPYSLNSREDRLDQALDQLKQMNCNMIRVLHWGGYQPTYEETLANLNLLDRFVKKCSDRNIRIWLTFHHRQRLPQDFKDKDKIRVWDKMFSPRWGGAKQGEIGDFFFFDDYLLGLLRKHQEDILTHLNPLTGLKYIDDPTIAIVTVANEKWCHRMPMPVKPPASGYSDVYWEKFNDYCRFNGLDPNKMKKPDITRFQALRGKEVYSGLVKHIRETGFKGVINCSSCFGDVPMTFLVEECGDAVDVHCYATPKGKLADGTFRYPDAFLMRSDYNFHRIVFDCRKKGKPVLTGEYSGVIESDGGSYADTFLGSPDVVARSGVNGAFIYAAYSHEINPEVNYPNEVYDAFKNANLVRNWWEAGKKFYSLEHRKRIELFPRYEDFFGSGIGVNYYIPIPGTLNWIDLMESQIVTPD